MVDVTDRCGILPVALWECTSTSVSIKPSQVYGDLWSIFEDGFSRRVSQLPKTKWAPPIDIAFPDILPHEVPPVSPYLASGSKGVSPLHDTAPAFVLPPLQLKYVPSGHPDFVCLRNDGDNTDLGVSATTLDSKIQPGSPSRPFAEALRSALGGGHAQKAQQASRASFGGSISPVDWHRLPVLNILLVSIESSQAGIQVSNLVKTWSMAQQASKAEWLVVYCPLGLPPKSGLGSSLGGLLFSPTSTNLQVPLYRKELERLRRTGAPQGEEWRVLRLDHFEEYRRGGRQSREGMIDGITASGVASESYRDPSVLAALSSLESTGAAESKNGGVAIGTRVNNNVSRILSPARRNQPLQSSGTPLEKPFTGQCFLCSPHGWMPSRMPWRLYGRLYMRRAAVFWVWAILHGKALTLSLNCHTLRPHWTPPPLLPLNRVEF